MDLDWNPVIYSAKSVDIPLVTVRYDPAALEGWRAANRPWLKSERTDYSVWAGYATLARSGRFLLPYINEPPSRRFFELHTAMLLQREGFTCWGGVRLFEYESKKFFKGKGNSKANTKKIRSMAPWWAPWPLPNDIQGMLKFQPRNPDLVAYSKNSKQWRFCEVKGPTESIDPDQLGALAVLHLLTAAPVAIVQVVEGTSKYYLSEIAKRDNTKVAKIAYKKGAELDWIHPKVLRRLLRNER
jgi:hypothetical protein